jgi:hypothetical protein
MNSLMKEGENGTMLGYRKISEITDCHVIKKFESERNDVYLVRHIGEESEQGFFVLKKYAPPLSKLVLEKELLLELKREGVLVPEIYKACEDLIFMEYINGPLLLDNMLEQETMACPDSSYLALHVCQMINSLSAWLKDFYATTRKLTGKQLILGDISFQNFIIGEKLYGIDFEDCREGDIEEDVGKICAITLTCRPAFTTWKLSLVYEMMTRLTEDLSLNVDRIKKELKKELIRLVPTKKGFAYKNIELLVSNLLERSLFVQRATCCR